MSDITPNFDQEATVAAVLYVAQRVENLTMHRLAKILYFADKAHLERYGRPITGDVYIAMNNGPVPSQTYNAVKELNAGSLFPHPLRGVLGVKRKVGRHYICALGAPDLDDLSDSDLACLDEAIALSAGRSFGELSDLSHDAAWQATERNQPMRLEAIVATFAQPEPLLEHLRDPNP